MAERRELGVVSLIKDHKFGFIRSSDRTEDTFFHMSEVRSVFSSESSVKKACAICGTALKLPEVLPLRILECCNLH